MPERFARRPENAAAAVLPAQNFQIFGVLNNIKNGRQQANASFSLIKPTFCSSSSERPRLVGRLARQPANHPAVHPVI